MPSRTPETRPAPQLFEQLEDRLALYTNPFLLSPPALTDLTNAANTVVRMVTNEGTIDIELYDRGGPNGAPTAPITSQNFLNYINSGRYAESFFHRLVATPTPFVLQGGGFTFTNADAPPRSTAIPTDAPIQNEFNAGRSNIERTIAMAKLGGDPNSATSQFFFNLADNGSNLDTQNGGFTVFGHVVKGWETVTTITGLQTRDLNQFLTGNPQDAFGQVPVTGSSDSDLVIVQDIEVIKPAGSQQFFSQAVYYPEGFRSGRIVSTIEMANPDPNNATPFEIIAHFEGGTRDKVIFTNTLAPGAHLEVPISQGGDPTVNKVRGGEAFGYEIRSARPLAATLHHKDFGSWAAESFIQPDGFQAEQLEAWNFANGVKGPNNPSFLAFENLSDSDANVNILFFPDGGTPFFIGKTVSALRRGGLDINQLPSVPDGAFSIQITSDQPIVVALSQYQVTPGEASTETGVIAGGTTEAVLPAAYIPSGGQAVVSALFTGQSPALVTIDFDFILSDGTVIPSTQPLVLSPAIPRRDLNLASAATLPTDTFFTIRAKVRSGAAPVSLSYTSTVLGDTVETAFQTFGSSREVISGGFTDPSRTDQRDVISVFNPFASATNAAFQLRFHFVDGDLIPSAGTGLLAPGHRSDINVRDLSEVMSKIASGSQFQHYSVSVESTFSGASTTGAVFTQLTRFDVGRDTVTTGPTFLQGENLLPITDPMFH